MDNNNPSVYTTNEGKIKNKPWYQTWRIIYVILGVVLVVELVFGAKTLLSPIPKTKEINLQPLTGASISLFSEKSSIKVGDTIPVKIKVWTGGYKTSGTDLVLHYNPSVLDASPNAFERGKIYSNYPLVSIDSKAGVIRISGVASNTKQTFSGIGELGLFNFKAKGKGVANLVIEFKKGQTNESNVMGLTTNEDYLEKVNNLKITVL